MRSRPVKTSIVILTYNQLQYTQACIASIRKFTEPRTYEIIVVDNLSTDGTREWLAEQTDILTLYNEENVGFPKGCNQGMKLASGDAVLLLNNDVIVTDNWLSLMTECLFSSDRIGAVGPATNSAYNYQEIPVSYQSLDEMFGFAARNNVPDSSKWEPRIKLIGFCMLIKKEVIDQIGLLDEQFTPGFCEDSDYGLRIIDAGYQMMMCRNVFVHHFGSTSFGVMPKKKQELLAASRKKFADKWGFQSAGGMDLRPDLINHIQAPRDQAIKVLDIGCACGAASLELKYRYPNAKIYGLEKNADAARIARTFAQVHVGDIEEGAPYPSQSFDYILLGNVLEQVNNPVAVLKEIRRILKPRGQLLSSVFNASYHMVVRHLMSGRWTYSDDGVLNRDNIRFYTNFEVDRLFQEAGFTGTRYVLATPPLSEEGEKWIEAASGLTQVDPSQLKASQIVCIATNNELDVQGAIVTALNQIEKGNFEPIGKLVLEGKADCNQLIEALHSADIANKPKALNDLAIHFYQAELYEHIVPLLQHALQLEPGHKDSLYNMGFILYKAGGNEQALYFLSQIDPKDAEVEQLIQAVQAR